MNKGLEIKRVVGIQGRRTKTEILPPSQNLVNCIIPATTANTKRKEGKMRKKWIFIGAILLALVVSSGVFAYTYTTATATISATAVELNFAEVSVVDTANIGTVMGKEVRNLPTDKKLFEVKPHAQYTGDLVVKVYLGNAGSLSYAYQHLNMKLYLENSEEEADAGHKHQLLTLDNGEVTFILKGQHGITCTLYLDGGSYSTNPYSPLAWTPGYEVEPQLFLEVTQR